MTTPGMTEVTKKRINRAPKSAPETSFWSLVIIYGGVKHNMDYRSVKAKIFLCLEASSNNKHAH